MDPLQRIGGAAREPATGADSTGEPSLARAPAHAALSAGERADARVLARLGDESYLVRVRSAAVLVHSSAPLPVGEVVQIDVAASGRPALLIAATESPPPALFAALVDGAPLQADLGRAPQRPLELELAALLETGATVPAERLRSLGTGHHLAVEGARLAVDVAGVVPRQGLLVVQRAAQAAEVTLVGPAPIRSGPPNWFEPLVRELQRVGESVPGVGEVLARVAHALRAREDGGDATVLLRERLVREFVLPENGAQLRERLLQGGTRFEAHLAAAARAAIDAPKAPLPRDHVRDLRVALAQALLEGHDSALHPAIARALDTLTANALLAAAREQVHEPAWFPLPILDGENATTAWVRWRREQRPGADGAPGESVARAVLAVEFSALGPVRVDAVLGARRLLVRIAVAREDVLAIVRTAGEQLSAKLSSSGRNVVFGAALEDAERLRAHPECLPDPGPRGWIDTIG